MHEAKRAGVPTPLIYQVDVENATITMEYIEGNPSQASVDSISRAEGTNSVPRIGEVVGKTPRTWH